jgi:hypothetical protein
MENHPNGEAVKGTFNCLPFGQDYKPGLSKPEVFSYTNSKGGLVTNGRATRANASLFFNPARSEGVSPCRV